ncbi:hypothetical protein COO91_10701 (plasmid) [Nostoc flagelliforme CCNUN1]|uniref:Uncharacterized protein n=1 Tax=Nostoc flagelliforme CCNUN1 TaxID=2038116 RepID=A0A2K8T9U4_9NOSO|nr:hypothetical protein COO91_10701 [Nostoc flagelliforme CCNUN1]
MTAFGQSYLLVRNSVLPANKVIALFLSQEGINSSHSDKMSERTVITMYISKHKCSNV